MFCFVRNNSIFCRETYPVGAFASASLQSLIACSINRKTLRNSLLPQLTTTESNIDNKFSEGDVKTDEEEGKDCDDSLMNFVDKQCEDCLMNFAETKSSDLSDILSDSFNESSVEVVKGDGVQQQECCFA